MTELIEIPARCGKAAQVAKGQTIKVVNTHGAQVVDTWAFNPDDMDECMSMEATRATVLKMRLNVGDAFYSNNRHAMLTIIEDTSPGVHDTLMAACDNYRYKLLGCTEYHDNCSDNLHTALESTGFTTPKTPSPLNLFMNIPWTEAGGLSFEAPVTKPGDSILMRAEMKLIVVFSACPQDILPINGELREPVEAHFEVV